ncbi:MAG: hypothetical protein HC802_09560 [Caldilineaceae bacterium]|nr:hypothetical protein [Caldilineaceae bacterium]
MAPIQQSIQADIYVHASRGAVWRHFGAISLWPEWYPRVLSVRWIEGEPWSEDAVMQVFVKNSLGMTASGLGVVRLCLPEERAVWENAMSGLTTVCIARFEENVGGCKLTLKKSYHGVGAVAIPLLKNGQRRALTQALQNLKKIVEGQPR